MEGKLPKHTVIGEFINEYIVPYQYEIFTCITNQIIKEFNLNVSDTYLDGTKIEANANKYKFVWKPTTFHKKLDVKIKEMLKKMNLEFKENKLIKSYELNDLIKKYLLRENIDINYYITSPQILQHSEEIYKYLSKLIEYEEKEQICGENRNSYFKTDKDATAMVLKEDYYSKLSHDFHAGYNIQVLVSSLLILMYGVYQERSDYKTFIPMNNLNIMEHIQKMNVMMQDMEIMRIINICENMV